MNYEPIFEKLLPAGDYFFKIIKSSEGTSKSGKPMLKMTVSVDDQKGNQGTVYWNTLLEFSGNIRRLSIAVNELEKYEDKSLEAYHFEGKTGKCLIETEENAQFGDKNVIKIFYAPKSEVKNSVPDIIDDSVPF